MGEIVIARRCNRVLSIDDDHGDNEATMRCQLPMGHEGPHQETYEGYRRGKVTVLFEKGFTPVKIERLQHMIPTGETCQFEDGRNCPFLAFIGMNDDWKEFACYLSGDASMSRFYPDEFHKGCV